MSGADTRAAGMSLARMRVFAGLSVADLARRAHVGASYLAAVEAGTKQATPEWVATIGGAIARAIANNNDEQEAGK